jgi:hypothetical protein
MGVSMAEWDAAGTLWLASGAGRSFHAEARRNGELSGCFRPGAERPLSGRGFAKADVSRQLCLNVRLRPVADNSLDALALRDEEGHPSQSHRCGLRTTCRRWLPSC